MSTHGALVVIGSGPGIGSNVARLFAERGFQKVFLLSRDELRLKKEAEFVQAAASKVEVDIVPVDLADTDNTRRALDDVESRLDGIPLECVLFNAARLGASKMLEWPAESLESDLRISVISMYIATQWAIPKLLNIAGDDRYNPTLIVTSGLLYKDPFPQVFSLATCKAAQFNLVNSLHKEYEPQGVHCGLIVVGGSVADKSEVTNARNISEEAWKLYQQPRGRGSLEVTMLDPDYQNHIKRRQEEIRR